MKNLFLSAASEQPLRQMSERAIAQTVTFRRETESDWRKVEFLTREAFWNVYRPGCTEHYVLHCYRSRPDFVPELDLVMEREGTLIGHVMYARSKILTDEGKEIPIMTTRDP